MNLSKIFLIVCLSIFSLADDWNMYCQSSEMLGIISDDYVTPIANDENFYISVVENSVTVDKVDNLVFVEVLFLATESGSLDIDNYLNKHHPGYFKILKTYNYKTKTYKNIRVDFYSCKAELVARREIVNDFIKIDNNLDKHILEMIVKEYKLK